MAGERQTAKHACLATGIMLGGRHLRFGQRR